MGREESASLEAPLPSSPWKQFGLDVVRRVRPIVIDGITIVAAILCMGVAHAALGVVLGHDARFLGRVPIGYWLDAAHIALLTRFVVAVWREFR